MQGGKKSATVPKKVLPIHSSLGRVRMGGTRQTHQPQMDRDNSSSTDTKTGMELGVRALPSPPLPPPYPQSRQHQHKTAENRMDRPSLLFILRLSWGSVSPSLGESGGAPSLPPGPVWFSAASPLRGFGRVAPASWSCSPWDQRHLPLWTVPSPADLSCGLGCNGRCRSLRRPRLHFLLSSRQKPGASHRCSSLC